jgi:hypothetical protein
MPALKTLVFIPPTAELGLAIGKSPSHQPNARSKNRGATNRCARSDLLEPRVDRDLSSPSHQTCLETFSRRGSLSASIYAIGCYQQP